MLVVLSSVGQTHPLPLSRGDVLFIFVQQYRYLSASSWFDSAHHDSFIEHLVTRTDGYKPCRRYMFSGI